MIPFDGGGRPCLCHVPSKVIERSREISPEPPCLVVRSRRPICDVKRIRCCYMTGHGRRPRHFFFASLELLLFSVLFVSYITYIILVFYLRIYVYIYIYCMCVDLFLVCKSRVYMCVWDIRIVEAFDDRQVRD